MQTDPTQKKFGIRFAIIAWLCVLFLLTLFFDEQLDKQQNPNSEVAFKVENDIPTVVLKRNRYGHYVANGFINGQPVTFMLDTGATEIAIPATIADRIGLQRHQQFSVNTANGRATAYSTRLDRLELGAISLHNIGAGIVPGYQSNEILLGMSVLKQLEFTQKGDTLTLRQY